jgi:hypothetical protein
MPRYAVNLCDLDQITPRTGLNMTALLLRDFCDEHSPTTPPQGGRWDEVGVVLDGPAAQDEARVEALVELLQTVIGPRKMGRRVRCYREGPKGGWSAVRPEKRKREVEEEDE